MAKQTFTTGQVLTAAEMTALQANDYNQTVTAKTASYVLVAADAGTRITMSNAGATTITVNTSLFTAGDTLFITNIGAGACTITAGTATVSTASSLVLAQYDSGRLYFTSTGVAIWEKYQGAAVASPSGMTKIVTANFSSVANVAINGCFTSTYTNYVVVFDHLANANNPGQIWLNMQYSTSTVEYTALYYNATTTFDQTPATTTYNGTGATKWILGNIQSVQRCQLTLNISGVGNTAEQVGFTAIGNLAVNGISLSGGILANNVLYTGLYLNGVGNLSGTYTVYGLAK